MFAASKTSAAAAAAPATDPQFNYVTMLLHGDGTNGAQNNTFVDSSTNNFTITRNGTPTQGSFSPYGDLWSNYFGGAGNYLTTPSISLGSSSFTLEAWVYRTAAKATEILASGTTSGGFNIGFESTGTVIEISRYNVAYIAQVSATVPLNQWFHIAVTRDGNSYRIFLNGTQVGTTVTDSNSISASAYRITDSATSGNNVTGYVSNLRIVTGTALYTSTFTPSTTPLTAVSGTSLLTCQSNRFRDNSSNNFAITVTGTPSVQRFSPFDPAAEYSTSVIGGSGIFGTSNYLSFTGVNAAFQFGTGDWTIETWAYATTIQAQRICDFRPTSNGAYPTVSMNSSGQFDYTANSAIRITGTTVAKPNTWYHVAVCRSGTSTRLFVNGVQEGVTYTDTTNYTVASGRPIIAADGFSLGSSAWAGYLADVRMLKGTALYTTTFTPPTAPLTAITNTSLLLNTVNAGIFDNAMMNDLVTVGDAQVSTAVVKYGTGSLKFDGTGDYLSAPGSDLHNLPGDFTVECWVYISGTGTQRIVGKWNGAGNVAWILQIDPASFIEFGYANSGTFGGSVKIFSAVGSNAWKHVAVTRSGTTVRFFVNGTQVGSGTISSNLTAPNTVALTIGQAELANYLNGYIDDLRITKGYARYTANFTPPTAAFPNL